MARTSERIVCWIRGGQNSCDLCSGRAASERPAKDRSVHLLIRRQQEARACVLECLLLLRLYSQCIVVVLVHKGQHEQAAGSLPAGTARVLSGDTEGLLSTATREHQQTHPGEHRRALQDVSRPTLRSGLHRVPTGPSSSQH